jgi:hypothetical protein
VRSNSNTITGQWGLSLRQVIAAALLAIVVVANFAVQTHVHGNHIVGPIAASTRAFSNPGPTNPADDVEHCPLCQEFLSGGNFLVPIAVVIAVPVLTGEVALPLIARVFGHFHSHNWQGRGPPAV